MVIKRYVVNNMNEAVTRIRYELGKDAVIISQRKVRKPGFVGLFSPKLIEVTAAIESVTTNGENLLKKEETIKKEDLATKENKSKQANEDSSIKESIEAIKKVIDNNEKQEKKEKQENAAEVSDKVKTVVENNEISDYVLKEMKEMKEMINDIAIKKTTERSPRKTKIQIKLESTELSETVSKKVIGKVKNIKEDLNEDEKLKLAIQKMIPVSNANMEGSIILVGPTGVGKTTTIAKLAGKLSLIEKKKVGLITVDTYRIGAVEQLKTYAEIMGLPFKVVNTVNEMEFALDSMKECDVILIDTTGRSSKNSSQISELKSFVEKVNTKNIQLVISSTTKSKDIDSIIAGYKPLNYNSIIITKLDETSTYGSILNIIDSAKKPLSYVTIGQNVPDDIKVLSAEEITNLILGVDCIC